MVMRFLIAPVTVTGNQLTILEDASIIEAVDFNEAGLIATTNYPDCQVMVVRIGRVLNVSAEDVLPLGQGAS